MHTNLGLKLQKQLSIFFNLYIFCFLFCTDQDKNVIKALRLWWSGIKSEFEEQEQTSPCENKLCMDMLISEVMEECTFHLKCLV